MTLRAQNSVDYTFDDSTMQGWTNIDADGDGYAWVSSENPGVYHNSSANLSGTGHNGSFAYVISGSYANQLSQALTPDNYLVSPQKAAYTNVSFWACAQDPSYPAEHFGVAVSTTDNNSFSSFATIQEWTMTAKQGNWYEYTVDLSAYAGQYIWVAIRHFNCTDEFVLNVDDITLEFTGTQLENIDEIYIEGYTAPVWGEHPDVDVEVPAGAHYIIADAFWYSTNLGAIMEPSDVFDDESSAYYMGIDLIPEDGYCFLQNATAFYNGYNTIHDSEHNMLYPDGRMRIFTIDRHVFAPLPDGSYDFEGSLEGWTTIDADGDGLSWELSSSLNPNNPAHHGNDFVFSRSYTTLYPLYPDNYLVSPEKAAYTEISFWACAHAAAYPAEHFGVAVSTTGNTSASDFTTIQEWTMTAKVQGNWYLYTVDLSEYAGQEIWVAIRHFDCTDQLYLDVDEVTLVKAGANVDDNKVSLFTVYPNPAADNILVESQVTVNRFEIYSMTGQIILENEVNASTFNVDIAALPAGSYIIRLKSDGMIQNRKFVKE